MKLLKDVTRVYIFESPSPQDLSVDRREGYSLGEMLRLSGIDYIVYNVLNKQELSDAFDELIHNVDSNKSIGVVTTHFSMHGNKNGLALTSGEFVSWADLAKLIKKFRSEIGQIGVNITPDFCLKIAPIALNFSACEGLNAYKINDYCESDETLFMHVLGPKVPVNWHDSLVSFVTFYHNTLSHNKRAPEAIFKMNLAGNLDNVFELKMGKNMAILP